MIFSWTGQILLFKNRDMSKRWEYQSTFYAIRDFKMKGGADGWMTYDGNVFNWEEYSVVNSVEKTTPNGEPEAGFRVFFRRPSTIPLKDFYD